MTLSFKTQIGGKPTLFIEKIWETVIQTEISTISDYQNSRMRFNDTFGHDWDDNSKEHHNPKLHTIREDKQDRWKAGTIIHPVINNRTPNRFQFAPCFPCVRVQDIEIKWKNGGFKDVLVDGYPLAGFDFKKLAINDGFDSIEDFFAYFNKDFVGKILHFTDLKY